MSKSILLFLLLLWAQVRATDTITAAENPGMIALAKLMQPDEDEYGCGALQEAGAAYHVRLHGDDAADGLFPATAWRTVRRGLDALRAGDTLWIGEGEYYEEQPLVLPRDEERCGAPGRPIRIMAMPDERVVITGARLLAEWTPAPGLPHVVQAEWQGRGIPFLWEADTHVDLQYGGLPERVKELPGTFWYDATAGKLYVRFTGRHTDGIPGVRVEGPAHGLEIFSHHVLVSGLTFRNYACGILVRPGASHITIERCTFFATHTAGLQLSSTQRCLVRENDARRNGDHGCLFIQSSPRNQPAASDNLIIRNRFHSTAPTLRSADTSGFAVHHWNGSGLRNHIIDNFLGGALSCWYKPMHRQVVIQGNVMTGAFNTTGSLPTLQAEGDRIIVRNNTLLGGMTWERDTWGPGGAGADWAVPQKAFVNNLQARADRSFFADPAYDDYRVQAGSAPAREPALGGGMRGASRQPGGRVLYVGGEGDDQAAGLSPAQAWRSLAAASERLKAGDTLYVLPGVYPEPLVVRAVGSATAPVVARAYGRSEVRLPGIEVHGAHVELEGFSVRNAVGDGVLVAAPNVSLRHILATGCSGAGVFGRAASGLRITRCTLADNGVAVRLVQNSTGARVRDSILASPSGAPLLDLAPDSTGFLAGQNCYLGSAPPNAAEEMGSLVADPLFLAPAQGDYSLAWNSPAATLAALAEPAGAAPVAARPITISEPIVAGLHPDSAAILWETPLDDTFGMVQYRLHGAKTWTEAASREQGTVHGAGLLGLQPDTEYEYFITARGRRGGEARSAAQRFRTAATAPAPAVYYLAPDGNDAQDGLSPATAWRTPRRASQAVAPGDTVRIAPGEYHHAIAPLRGGLPGRRIAFRRDGEDLVRFHGSGIVAPLVLLVGTDYVTIEGLDFDIGVGLLPPGASPPALTPGGVMGISNCKDIEIIACRGGSRAPLGMGGGSNFINAGNVEKMLIERCVSWGARYHIWFHNVAGLIVRNNTLVHSQIIAFIVDGQAERIELTNNLWVRPCGMAAKNNEVLLFRGPKRPELYSDYNLFYSQVTNHQRIAVMTDAIRVPVLVGDTLETWQAQTQQDMHSFRADPLFVDYAKGDFRLRPDSPAIGAGRNGATLGALPVATEVTHP
jgi:hypothetical protein